jgi:hypothetical protein
MELTTRNNIYWIYYVLGSLVIVARDTSHKVEKTTVLEKIEVTHIIPHRYAVVYP